MHNETLQSSQEMSQSRALILFDRRRATPENIVAYRPMPAFLSQLLACAGSAMQFREKRRAEPLHASASYRATLERSPTPLAAAHFQRNV
jgi:hypothetical protein